MNLWAAYNKERRGTETIETSEGFVSYSISNPDIIYLEDLYITPECRKSGASHRMADRVVSIGRSKGCKFLLSSVDLKSKGVTASLRATLSYPGIEFDSIQGSGMFFKKAI